MSCRRLSVLVAPLVASAALLCACKDERVRVVVPSPGAAAAAAPPSPGAPSLASPAVKAAHRPPVPLKALRVTTGHVVELPGGRLHVTEPTTRFVGAGAPRSAEVRFTYRGPTAKVSALSSGEVRRQLGLKLRAKNGCNVVYAIWRLEPEAKLVVSVKRNEGESTHLECGAGGYENITPTRSAPVPRVAVNESHVLAARIDGARLRVTIDGAEAWEGELPQEAFQFNGPAGVRTDNVDVDLDFSAGE